MDETKLNTPLSPPSPTLRNRPVRQLRYVRYLPETNKLRIIDTPITALTVGGKSTHFNRELLLLLIIIIINATNVEPEMYDYTSNNLSYWNSNEKLKEKFGSCTRKTFDKFTTKDSCTWNITHNTESTTVWSLKPEWWGSPLVQEKYQEENACDKRR